MAEGWNRQQPILKLCSSNRSVKKRSKSVPPINSLSYPESHKSVKEKDIKVRKTQSTIQNNYSKVGIEILLNSDYVQRHRKKIKYKNN